MRLSIKELHSTPYLDGQATSAEPCETGTKAAYSFSTQTIWMQLNEASISRPRKLDQIALMSGVQRAAPDRTPLHVISINPTARRNQRLQADCGCAPRTRFVHRVLECQHLSRRRLLVTSRTTQNRSDSDSTVLDNDKGSRPVGSFRECADSDTRHAVRRFSTDAEEDDAGSGGGAEAEGQLTEVLVERQQDSTFQLRAGQNLRIRSAGGFFVHPDDIVPMLSKCRHRRRGHVLVRKESPAHRLPRGQRIDLL